MVQILNEIPQNEAGMTRLPKYMPHITVFGEVQGVRYQSTVAHGEIRIPNHLLGQYFAAFGVKMKNVDADNVEEIRRHILAVHKKEGKEVYIREVGENKDEPIKIVSAKFEEVDLRDLSSKVIKTLKEQISDYTHSNPLIRQFTDDRLVLNFPVDNKALPGLNIMVEGGTYASYGGSGRTALHYGISWNNEEVNQWTLFLGKTLGKEFGRAIHLKGDMLPQRLEQLLLKTDEVASKVDSSKRTRITQDDLQSYLKLYQSKGFSRPAASQILAEMNLIDGYSINTKSAPIYGVASKIVQVAYGPTRFDRTKFRGEAMAGELIYNHKDIK